jgi:hypothetical protein
MSSVKKKIELKINNNSSMGYVLRNLLLPTIRPPEGLDDLVPPFGRSCGARGPLLLSMLRSLPSGRLRRDVMFGAAGKELEYPVVRGALDGPVDIRSFPLRLREVVPRARFWSTI